MIGPVTNRESSFHSSTRINFADGGLKLLKIVLPDIASHSIGSNIDESITVFAAYMDGDGDVIRESAEFCDNYRYC
ncbi:MAG: hypothetical protein KAS73_03135 [Candidatus Sabulitectum sp.]|nr:hypothetical protein [Candidatus Sabulitectum sp.]